MGREDTATQGCSAAWCTAAWMLRRRARIRTAGDHLQGHRMSATRIFVPREYRGAPGSQRSGRAAYFAPRLDARRVELRPTSHLRSRRDLHGKFCHYPQIRFFAERHSCKTAGVWVEVPAGYLGLRSPNEFSLSAIQACKFLCVKLARKGAALMSE